MTDNPYEDVPWSDLDPDTRLNADAEAAAELDVARQRFRVLSRDDLDALPLPDPVIVDVLPGVGSLVALTGSRGLGKSLIATALNGVVSTDLPTWNGYEVRHHGPTLYVSREGFPAVPNRVRAWEAVNGRRLDRVWWIRDPMDLKRPVDVVLLAAVARHLGAVMVTVDSARATGAGKEDTADMGEYVAGLEALRDRTGALVLALHNTGWDRSRERGSTLLPDAMDTAFILEGEPGRGKRSLRHSKHRDGEMLVDPLWLEWRGVDGTGSGVLVPSDAPADAATTRDLVREYVATNPGQATGRIAEDIVRTRSKVATTLSELAAAGLVVNEGTHAHPSWRTV
jgi:energy-coupling factor transporter ATP-binding protein EcfA2